jgi:hypothetical protein
VVPCGRLPRSVAFRGRLSLDGLDGPRGTGVGVPGCEADRRVGDRETGTRAAAPVVSGGAGRPPARAREIGSEHITRKHTY